MVIARAIFVWIKIVVVCPPQNNYRPRAAAAVSAHIIIII